MHKVEVILRVGRGGWRVRQRGESEAEGEGGLESEAERGGVVRRGGWRVESEAEGCGEWGKGGGEE